MIVCSKPPTNRLTISSPFYVMSNQGQPLLINARTIIRYPAKPVTTVHADVNILGSSIQGVLNEFRNNLWQRCENLR